MPETNEFTPCAMEALLASDEKAEEMEQDTDVSARVMADAMPQIVWQARPDGWREYFNQRWYEHTRMTTTETVGHGWTSGLHEEDQKRCLDAWTEAVQGSQSFEIEYRLLCAEDGSYRWHIERALPVMDPSCRVVKWFGTCTDIDGMKRAEARIEELNTRLRVAMKETHHRVKNNLQIISAMVDMQLMNGEETISSGEFKRLGSHIRTLATVHDILTQDADAGEGEAKRISAKEVLEKLLPLHQHTSPNCTITARLDDIRLPGRQATALALVANELVSNAVKHGRGRVEVYLTVQERSVVLEVCDGGAGFPAGFDPAQAANTGLELVENLARWDLNGRMVYENRVEGGARVCLMITLPL